MVLRKAIIIEVQGGDDAIVIDKNVEALMENRIDGKQLYSSLLPIIKFCDALSQVHKLLKYSMLFFAL